MKSSTAHALDGELHISGSMDVIGHTPHYEIEAQLDDASARAVSGLFTENWGPGSISLQTSMQFSGFAQKDLLSAASGSFQLGVDQRRAGDNADTNGELKEQQPSRTIR